LPLKQAAGSLGVGLCQLEIRFALPDRGARDLGGGFGLPHLLEDFLVLDLGDPLAATDAIAELDRQVHEPAGGLGHNGYGLVANQIADDGQFLIDLSACGRRDFDRQLPSTVASAATASTGPALTRASTGTASLAGNGCLLCAGTRLRGVGTAEHPRIEGHARERRRDDYRYDDNFLHSALGLPVQ